MKREKKGGPGEETVICEREKENEGGERGEKRGTENGARERRREKGGEAERPRTRKTKLYKKKKSIKF